jgi:exosortase D (VPLPA-CTERM-specific)
MSTYSLAPKPVQSSAWVLGCLSVLLAAVAFRGALFELARRWATQEEYSHGFLIPVISAWLIWSRRKIIIASFGSPSWTGVLLILLAMFIHVAGLFSAIFILSQFAFIVALLGIVLILGGFSLLRAAFFPIIFLTFAIPLPYFIDAALSLKLQLISSQLGVFFIRLFGIPVYLDGNLIDLGNYKIQVVDACSGLRYLFPLLSLSSLAAYLFNAPLWQRTLILLSSIPITVAMNGFRIGIVGLTVDRWGPRMADEALHFFEGWIIFMACAVLLALEAYLLALLSGRPFFQVFGVPGDPVKSPAKSESKSAGHRIPFYASLFLICLTTVTGFLISNRSEIIPERNRFVSFPTTIGEWRGHSSQLETWAESALAVDDYVLSDYSNVDGKVVNLYVAYYASQRTGESPHSPLVCIPGTGWSITRLDRLDGETTHPLNRAIIERNGSKQLVYYWYEERGKSIASEYWSKWYLLSDAITKNRSDGALVRLITTIGPGETERDADNRLRAFTQDLRPQLRDYLPPAIAANSLGSTLGRKKL